MKKKKKTKTRKKIPGLTKEALFIMTLLKYTQRNITGDGSDQDKFFTAQADKLRKRLEEVK